MHGEQRAVVTESGATLRVYEVGARAVVEPFEGPDTMVIGCQGEILAPWPNRVVDGRYSFQGEEQQLAITEPDRGHALHGLAVWLDFAIVSQSDDRVLLQATVQGQAGYPHRIALSIEYLLDGDGLTCSFLAENTGPSRAPFGTGPHPYLVAGPEPVDEWTLTLPATRILEVDERLSPLQQADVPADLDFRSGRVLGGTQLDHAFTGIERDESGLAEVRLESPSGGWVSLRWGSEYPWAQVFTSDLPEERFRRRGVAVEPMTCPPDAFNSGVDLFVLEPGQEIRGAWRLAAF